MKLSHLTLLYDVKTKHEDLESVFNRGETGTPADQSTVLDFPYELVKGFLLCKNNVTEEGDVT